MFTLEQSGKKTVNLVTEINILKDKSNQDRIIVEFKKVCMYYY